MGPAHDHCAVKLTRHEAEDFLYHEAALLDDRDFEAWLDLFTEDGVYWLPMDVDADPEGEPSILYDDAATRAHRVHQIIQEDRFSQSPSSATVHSVTNVQVAEAEDPAECVVRCSLLVHELRGGDYRQFGLGQERTIAGRCEYRLRYEDGWRIRLKEVVLVNRYLPLENFTFIV
jgi:3-phenylpropionate/cinnamic acid dioxygenase small subunit